MKRIAGLVAGVAVASALLAAHPVSAQGGARVYLGGGSSLALGDFGDQANNGPHGVIGVGFTPANFPIGIRVDGRYHRISGDEDVLGPDVDAQIIDGTVNGVYSFSTASETKLRPYLIAGVGVYNLKPIGDNAVGDSETKFGINGGAGFDYRLKENLGLFVEGRFHDVFTDGGDTQFVPISAGVRIGR